ncbi:hypothetical protein AWC02_13975 [Mycolicibacter engbaekii]|uniref:Uncharacterized protein n=1 Tax=Mycolicibacter engbaekii TaxID=188915 RepID=A0A1X1TL81_9MYCO|nr:hypothetical protein [Mycolicibacter engbaekii]ORV45335.1 hypothetical protein AWC02_13975 [Mycolicibacter engbaekii]
MSLATLGFGIASAKAVPGLIDEPMPMPMPTPLGGPALPGLSGGLPGGLPGAAAPGSSASGMNAANSFLQVLNGMLNRVIPGVGSIVPTDVSSLTPPGSPMSVTPALEAPPAPPASPALVPQTLAGARTFH